MDNKKDLDIKEETSTTKQSLDVNKGPILFGSIDPPKPKEYLCSRCGIILAADILWKDTENGVQKPFCEYCRQPVLLRSN